MGQPSRRCTRACSRAGLVPARDKGKENRKRLKIRTPQELWDQTKASDAALKEALKAQKHERMETTSRQKHLADWPKAQSRIQPGKTPARLAAERLKNAERGNRRQTQQKEKQCGGDPHRAGPRRRGRRSTVAARRLRARTVVAHENGGRCRPIEKRAASQVKDLDKYLEEAKKRIQNGADQAGPGQGHPLGLRDPQREQSTHQDGGRPQRGCDPDLGRLRQEAGDQAARYRSQDRCRDLATDRPHSATRIKLKSVQVGPFKVNDVECLVFSEGYEAPPPSGDQLPRPLHVSTWTPGEARLMLTKVDEPH